jgi:hypothetical protein
MIRGFPIVGSRRRGSVLSDKDRMILHRRLPAVIHRFGIGQPFGDEIPRVLEDCRKALLLKILGLSAGEPKSAAKSRSAQHRKYFINVTHARCLLHRVSHVAITGGNY